MYGLWNCCLERLCSESVVFCPGLVFTSFSHSSRRSYYLFFNYLLLLFVRVTRMHGFEREGVTRMHGFMA